MAKIDVEEADLLQMQKVYQTVQQIVANPKARRLIQEAQKTINPNVVLPTDYQDEVRAEIAERDKRIEALEKAQKDDKEARETEKRTTAFTSKWEGDKARMLAEGVFPETVAEIEKFAHEQGIPDFEAATLKYLKYHPQPAPVEPGNLRSFSFFEPPAGEANADMKALIETHGDSESALNALIGKTLNEVRGTPRRAA